jgi:hypothetical protein
MTSMALACVSIDDVLRMSGAGLHVKGQCNGIWPHFQQESGVSARMALRSHGGHQRSRYQA